MWFLFHCEPYSGLEEPVILTSFPEMGKLFQFQSEFSIIPRFVSMFVAGKDTDICIMLDLAFLKAETDGCLRL